MRTKIIIKKWLTSLAPFRRLVAACLDFWPAWGATNPRLVTSQLCSDIVRRHVLSAS